MRAIIDTDAGVDDSLAIIYAARSKELKLEMISTVSGNVPVREVTQNVLLLRELLGLEFPVYQGASLPLNGKLLTAPEVHGDDGLGGFRLSLHRKPATPDEGDAPEQIVKAARKYGRKLKIISIGPMTNIAKAAALDKAAMRSVSEIIQLGGNIFGYGNTTPFTEFNIAVDPEAASLVLSSRLPVTFITLDLTELIFITRKYLTEVMRRADKIDRRLKKLISRSVAFYMDYHLSKDKHDGCFLHDPIAVAAAVNPNWFQFSKVRIDIETSGSYTAGMTVTDLRSKSAHPNCRIAVAFDAVGFLRDFMAKVFEVGVSPATIRRRCLTTRSIPHFGCEVD